MHASSGMPFIECVEVLWANMSEAFPCARWLKGRAEANVAAKGHEEHLFNVPPATVSHIEKDWVAGYIRDKMGFGEAVLAKCQNYDPQTPLHLLCAKANVSPGLKLGEEARDKLVLAASFDFRISETCDTFLPDYEHISASGYINSLTGVVDWGKLGPYKVEVGADGVGKRLVHRPSGDTAELDQDLNVTAAWDLAHNYNGLKTLLVKSKARKYKCAAFFGKLKGPHKSPPLTGASDVWKELMQRAVKHVCTNRKKAGERASEGNAAGLSHAFDVVVKTKHQESIKRAREQLQKRKEERGAKRRCSVGSATVNAPA